MYQEKKEEENSPAFKIPGCINTTTAVTTLTTKGRWEQKKKASKKHGYDKDILNFEKYVFDCKYEYKSSN